ncbi:MAG: aldose epimerase family protein [Bacteroidota bacterium]
MSKLRILITLELLAFLLFLFCCQPQESPPAQEQHQSGLTLSKADFGQMPEGDAYLFHLQNDKGMEVKITNYGATITSIKVPDKQGKLAEVVLGFDSLAQYLGPHHNLGTTIGRYGNRIAGGQFAIDGNSYALSVNNDPNTLHGGAQGFDKKLWTATPIESSDRVGVELNRLSPDLEEGFPGNLEVKLRYWLNNENELHLEYEATSDKKTVCNLTNHAYFNLRGDASGDVQAHLLLINADSITPVDATMIPTGERMAVAGTPFDFRQPKAVGAEIEADHQQLRYGNGYDHNFVLNRQGEGLELAAIVYDPNSGRRLEVLTEEPGVQLYTANWLDVDAGHAGQPYRRRGGLCLETQHFPDSPNQPQFPSTLLEPGEVYATKTVYRFSNK